MSIITDQLIPKLVDNACKGIKQYFNDNTGLFDYLLTDETVQKEKKSLLHTHSLISLLGISYHKDKCGINYNKAVEMINQILIAKPGGIRERSLLSWLLAKGSDDRAAKAYESLIKLPEKEIIKAETMELAWMLTALVFEYKRINDPSVKLKLSDTAMLLKKRFIEKNSLFLHRDPRYSKFDLRYNIGNFADQIYSIYAFSMMTKLTDEKKHIKTAEACADRLVSLQGEKGQWWWHYNASDGSVIQKFPVFSVHQDSMTPFSFMALTEVSEKDYNPYISLGLRWLTNENELNANMINENKNYVRRGIQRKPPLSKIQKFTTVASKLSTIFSLPEKFDEPRYLQIMNWEHSYHLGWILYAYNEENKHLWSAL